MKIFFYIQSPKNQLSLVSKIDNFLLQTILQKIFHKIKSEVIDKYKHAQDKAIKLIATEFEVNKCSMFVTEVNIKEKN